MTTPIACTLPADELHARRGELLPGLAASALQHIRLPEGMRFVFAATARRLRELHAVAELERRCCAFLDFRIDLSPGGGALTLDVIGPAGTGRFLEGLLQRPLAA
jgi:hypothetical protein